MAGQNSIKVIFYKAVSTVGGLGYFPYAPGTLASAAGAVFCFFLKENLFIYSLAFAVFFFLGIASAGKMEGLTKTKDPSCVVIDEFACVFLVFFAVPMTTMTVLLGFALYRAFDVLKPQPIRLIEKIGGSWGIMLDDLAAGFLAHIFLRILIFVIY